MKLKVHQQYTYGILLCLQKIQQRFELQPLYLQSAMLATQLLRLVMKNVT